MEMGEEGGSKGAEHVGSLIVQHAARHKYLGDTVSETSEMDIEINEMLVPGNICYHSHCSIIRIIKSLKQC